jgi:hypothetical protein
MKKRLLLLTASAALFSFCNGQTAAPAKTPDDIQFNGYQIHLFQTVDHGYGYDILYQNALVRHQNNNPYTNSPAGLKNLEDAVKTAKWQVIHLTPPGKQLQPGKQTIPMAVAAQLKIALN